MMKTIIPGRADIELFVESIFDEFGNILKEEHINKTDKLKTYRDYDNGNEVKFELANMLEDFAYKYESNDYIRRVDFHSSRKEGLSNYIEITFNTPFGSKEWLKHLKIRISDHPKRNGRKVDEYVSIEGNSVNDIEKELDRIVNKRIRRIEREYNLPMAQNENIERNKDLKLRINESNSSNIISKLNNLDMMKGYSDKTYDINQKYNLIKQYEDLLNQLDIGDIISYKSNAGTNTFIKQSNDYIGWLEILAPHYDFKECSTYDVAYWIAISGNIIRSDIKLGTDIDIDKRKEIADYRKTLPTDNRFSFIK